MSRRDVGPGPDLNSRDELSRPRGAPGGPLYKTDAFGPAAERFARFFGTPRYLAWQTVLVGVWIAMNAVAWSLRWDKYPFILLNLVFSTQAAYAAPLILLAQNRQADRDKAEMERDRERSARALADMEFLAREISGIRLALEHKADREDVTVAVDRLTRAVERLSGAELGGVADGEPDDHEDGEDT